LKVDLLDSIRLALIDPLEIQTGSVTSTQVNLG
jgi:hypothetical protein